MALTVRQKRARNAVYQARWRAKREALLRAGADERALMQAAERCERLLTQRQARHIWSQRIFCCFGR